MTGFWTKLLNFEKDEIFVLLSAAQMESTFALNVIQKLGHCFTFTILFPLSITRCRGFWKQIHYIGAYSMQSDGGTFLLLLYVTSWKTLNQQGFPGNPYCITSRKTDSQQYNTVIPPALHSFIPPPPSTTCWASTRPVLLLSSYWSCHFLATSLPSINIQTLHNPSYSSFTCLGRWNR